MLADYAKSGQDLLSATVVPAMSSAVREQRLFFGLRVSATADDCMNPY
jgi:hypothetical protein